MKDGPEFEKHISEWFPIDLVFCQYFDLFTPFCLGLCCFTIANVHMMPYCNSLSAGGKYCMAPAVSLVLSSSLRLVIVLSLLVGSALVHKALFTFLGFSIESCGCGENFKVVTAFGGSVSYATILCLDKRPLLLKSWMTELGMAVTEACHQYHTRRTSVACPFPNF